MKKWVIIFSVFISLGLLYSVNYVPKSVAGIRTAGMTLVVNQSNQQTKQLHILMEQTLNKDSKALAKLINFDCGGGSGCYDLGYLITQIIYRMGEDEFITMIPKLSSVDKMRLRGVIEVGLEYGYGELDNLRMETAFPSINAYLNHSKP